MELNLHIIYHDLKDLKPQQRIREDCLVRKLKYPSFYESASIPALDRLYVVTVEQLDTVPTGCLAGSPNFFCIGTPSDELVRNSNCNLVWTNEPAEINELFSRLSASFFRYNRWHLDMEQVLNRNKPLRRLGELASEIFRRPIWVWDQFYETVFHVVDRQKYTLPKDYTVHEDHEPWPLWEIDAWREGDSRGIIDINSLSEIVEPYILPSSEWFDYRALCSNIFVGDEHVATVSVDEIGGTVTERDYALLHFFCGVLSSGIRRDLTINMSMTANAYERIKDLLDAKRVAHSDLATALGTIGWKVEDPMICLVAAPMNPYYSDSLLSQTAEKIGGLFDGVIYTIHDHAIIFIVNLRVEQEPSRVVIDRIMFRLRERKCQTRVGVSVGFEDFSNLFMYYMEAIKALEYGKRDEPECREIRYYRYDDYILHSVIENIRDHAIPEIICPTGLMHLKRYDADNKTDYAPILQTYLENEMHVAETARKLFMHRNTLLNKLKKIQELIEVDLDDPDNRLVLQLAFKVLQGVKNDHEPERVSEQGSR